MALDSMASSSRSLGYMQGGEFHDQLSNYQPIKYCYMQIVNNTSMTFSPQQFPKPVLWFYVSESAI
jgi:hypothetical protein